MPIRKGDRVSYTVMYNDGLGHGLEHIVLRTAHGHVTRLFEHPRRGIMARIAVEDPKPGETRYVEREYGNISLAPVIQPFVLDEEAAAGAGFDDRFPVDDDHSASLAIDGACHGDEDDVCVTSPPGWTMYCDLLANGDGELDGYRILIKHDDLPFYLASEIRNIGFQQDPPALDVLRDAVAAANGLLTHYQEAQ